MTPLSVLTPQLQVLYREVQRELHVIAVWRPISRGRAQAHSPCRAQRHPTLEAGKLSSLCIALAGHCLDRSHTLKASGIQVATLPVQVPQADLKRPLQPHRPDSPACPQCLSLLRYRLCVVS